MPEVAVTGRAMLVEVSGLLRGRDVATAGVLRFEGDDLVIATQRAPIVLPLAVIDGVVRTAEGVELHVYGGDVLQLAGSAALVHVVDEIAERVMVLPELTRSLRHLGARHAAGHEHDRFFAPVLDARRAAEQAATADAVRTAFDARAIASRVVQMLRDVAAERYPRDLPEQRALDAELGECVEALLARLDDLARAERGLLESDDTNRFARWRSWSATLQQVFGTADVAWQRVSAVLVEERREPRGRWRRGGRGRRAGGA